MGFEGPDLESRIDHYPARVRVILALVCAVVNLLEFQNLPAEEEVDTDGNTQKGQQAHCSFRNAVQTLAQWQDDCCVRLRQESFLLWSLRSSQRLIRLSPADPTVLVEKGQPDSKYQLVNSSYCSWPHEPLCVQWGISRQRSYSMANKKSGSTSKIGRDAKTGEFIPVKEAKARPATTVVETIKHLKKK